LEEEQVTRTERKKQEARKKIIAAAEQLFVMEHSYEKTTIKEIAERADVGVGSVYAHFETKAQILLELVTLYTGQICSRMRETISGAGTGAEKMVSLLEFFEGIRKEPSFPLYSSLSPLPPVKDNAELKQYFNEFRKMIAGILKTGGADGSIRRVKNPDITAITLIGIVLSYILDLVETNSFSYLSLIHSYDADTLWEGFYALFRNALGIEVKPKK
jgi:AcrR family transcriptional regulator